MIRYSVDVVSREWDNLAGGLCVRPFWGRLTAPVGPLCFRVYEGRVWFPVRGLGEGQVVG